MTQLNSFIDLIQKFLDRRIGVQEFIDTFLEKFVKEDSDLDEEAFSSLDWLFAQAYSYSDDPQLFIECPGEHINETQLRVSAQKTLEQLKDR
jgi:Bacterial self-protective colicin-like immunity